MDSLVCGLPVVLPAEASFPPGLAGRSGSIRVLYRSIDF
ncbi:hypothetical protein O6P43_035203, partial [Quillaja saponaria]